jgi:hypothetical protein
MRIAIPFGALMALALSPPAGRADEKKDGFDLQSVRLLVPLPEIKRRLGATDAEALANYGKTMVKTAKDVLAKEPKPKADGLMIVIGIKPGGKARVWCQAVDGDVPADTLRKLEAELGKVKTLETKENFAFTLECRFGAKEVKQFPIIPTAWTEAAKGAKKPPIVPDEMFPLVWKD